MTVPPTGNSASSNPTIKIKTHIELAEYRKLMFLISFTSPVLIIIVLIGIALVTYLQLNGTGTTIEVWLSVFITLFILYMPFGVYRTATANYRSTKYLREIVTYEFTRDTITTTGETFNSTVQWRSLYKIKETKEWILLYMNKQLAAIIPKKAFASEADLSAFRKMCNLE